MKYQLNSEVIDDCLVYFIILWWVSHFGFEMWACYESDLVFIRRLPFNVNIYMVILYIGRDRGQGTRNDEKVIKIGSRLSRYKNY